MIERDYIAFISYRHMPHDQAIAEETQRLIERFVIPKALRSGDEKHLGYVFRDQDELPVSSNLSENIWQALDHSRYLIVVCTPDTRKSKWCMEEINYFLKTHDTDHVLVILAAGTPEESFPEQLLHNFDANGNIIKDIEPLGADVTADSIKSSLKRLRHSEYLRIVATLGGFTYDSLVNRMQRYQKRRRAVIAGIALGIVAGFMIMMSVNARRVREQYEAAQIRESRYLAKTSQEALDGGDRLKAMNIALFALPSENNDRPYTTEPERVLSKALHAYSTNQYWNSNPDFVFKMSDRITWTTTLDERYVCAVTESEWIGIFDVVNGKPLWQKQLADFTRTMKDADDFGRTRNITYLADKKRLLIQCTGGIMAVDLSSAEVQWSIPLSIYTSNTVFATTKNDLYIAGINPLNGEIVLSKYDLADGTIIDAMSLGCEYTDDTGRKFTVNLFDMDVHEILHLLINNDETELILAIVAKAQDETEGESSYQTVLFHKMLDSDLAESKPLPGIVEAVSWRGEYYCQARRTTQTDFASSIFDTTKVDYAVDAIKWNASSGENTDFDGWSLPLSIDAYGTVTPYLWEHDGDVFFGVENAIYKWNIAKNTMVNLGNSSFGEAIDGISSYETSVISVSYEDGNAYAGLDNGMMLVNDKDLIYLSDDEDEASYRYLGRVHGAYVGQASDYSIDVYREIGDDRYTTKINGLANDTMLSPGGSYCVFLRDDYGTDHGNQAVLAEVFRTKDWKRIGCYLIPAKWTDSLVGITEDGTALLWKDADNYYVTDTSNGDTTIMYNGSADNYQRRDSKLVGDRILQLIMTYDSKYNPAKYEYRVDFVWYENGNEAGEHTSYIQGKNINIISQDNLKIGQNGWIILEYETDAVRKLLVCNYNDDTEHVWNGPWQYGKPYMTVISNQKPFYASADADSTVRIMNLETGDIVASYAGLTAPVYWCAFSRDDSDLIALTEDKKLYVLSVATGTVKGSSDVSYLWDYGDYKLSEDEDNYYISTDSDGCIVKKATGSVSADVEGFNGYLAATSKLLIRDVGGYYEYPVLRLADLKSAVRKKVRYRELTATECQEANINYEDYKAEFESWSNVTDVEDEEETQNKLRNVQVYYKDPIVIYTEGLKEQNKQAGTSESEDTSGKKAFSDISFTWDDETNVMRGDFVDLREGGMQYDAVVAYIGTGKAEPKSEDLWKQFSIDNVLTCDENGFSIAHLLPDTFYRVNIRSSDGFMTVNYFKTPEAKDYNGAGAVRAAVKSVRLTGAASDGQDSFVAGALGNAEETMQINTVQELYELLRNQQEKQADFPVWKGAESALALETDILLDDVAEESTDIWTMRLLAPGGSVIEFSKEMTLHSGEQTVIMPMDMVQYFRRLLNGFGYIPTGSYELQAYCDNGYVGTVKFELK